MRDPFFTLDSVLALPVVKLAGAAVALLTCGWFARDYATGIESSIKELTNEVKRLRIELSQELDRRTSDRYTRTEHRIWALELERANAGKLAVPAVSANPPNSP
jgi:hypothetical protein